MKYRHITTVFLTCRKKPTTSVYQTGVNRGQWTNEYSPLILSEWIERCPIRWSTYQVLISGTATITEKCLFWILQHYRGNALSSSHSQSWEKSQQFLKLVSFSGHYFFNILSTVFLLSLRMIFKSCFPDSKSKQDIERNYERCLFITVFRLPFHENAYSKY